MPIVFACAASHAPGMTAWTEAAPRSKLITFSRIIANSGLGSRDPGPTSSSRSRSSTGLIFFSITCRLFA